MTDPKLDPLALFQIVGALLYYDNVKKLIIQLSKTPQIIYKDF